MLSKMELYAIRAFADANLPQIELALIHSII
jgi:hypothetical protein